MATPRRTSDTTTEDPTTEDPTTTDAPVHDSASKAPAPAPTATQYDVTWICEPLGRTATRTVDATSEAEALAAAKEIVIEELIDQPVTLVAHPVEEAAPPPE